MVARADRCSGAFPARRAGGVGSGAGRRLRRRARLRARGGHFCGIGDQRGVRVRLAGADPFRAHEEFHAGRGCWPRGRSAPGGLFCNWAGSWPERRANRCWRGGRCHGCCWRPTPRFARSTSTPRRARTTPAATSTAPSFSCRGTGRRRGSAMRCSGLTPTADVRSRSSGRGIICRRSGGVRQARHGLAVILHRPAVRAVGSRGGAVLVGILRTGRRHRPAGLRAERLLGDARNRRPRARHRSSGSSGRVGAPGHDLAGRRSRLATALARDGRGEGVKPRIAPCPVRHARRRHDWDLVIRLELRQTSSVFTPCRRAS